MRPLMWTLLVGAAVCFSSACGPPPHQACQDMADAAAHSLSRCGVTFEQGMALFLANAAHGSCDNVVSIRDEGELYDHCIPLLVREVTCDDWQKELPQSCRAQLEQ